MENTLSLDDLRGILIACAGEDNALDGDISDVSFDDLGYDSLALIETAAVLKRDYGVVLPEDQLTVLSSPGELLSLINDRPA
ncbi:acyl carrier protein [Micromonospora rifamycinica]|uniref:Act minimal PKS acyl carrier protein n=1 Tax=Micromonospora rifamycinica TaxID=291594 RepID=A0A1C5HM26_9ACTN|nr:acyl carrier protein [Micromonospora rifamycinica]SCG46963.1 act minimal PKS acyl carrier protein [Micromonospora rifamycinica]